MVRLLYFGMLQVHVVWHECITGFSVGCVLESVSRFFHYKAFSHEMFQYNYDISDDNRLFHTTVWLREMPSQ